MNARTRSILIGTLGLCLGFDWPGHAQRLAADLSAAGPRERREIVRLLAATSSEEARPAILKACSDQDASVRREALRAAGRLGAMEALPILLGALSDPDPTLRATAAEALGALAVDDAIQPLSRALADSEASVRRAAVGALAKLPQGAQQPALLAALDDVDAEVRREAVRNLASTTSERARDALLGKTRDPSPDVRAEALDAIAGSGEPRAALAFAQALDDSSDTVVLAALRGLRALPSNGVDARALIAPLVRSPRDRVAAAAALSLEQVESAAASDARPPARAVPTLPAAWMKWLERSAYPSSDAPAIVAGLESTLPEGEQLALEPLLLFLPNISQGLRPRVVALIGRTRAPHAGPHLVKLLNDPDGAVRRAASHALAQSGGAAAVPHLLPLLEDRSLQVRAAAADALGALADPNGFRALLKRAESGAMRARQAPLLSALADSVRGLRHELSSDDKARLLSVLHANLRSAEAALATEAARGLGELGDAAAVPVLSAMPPHARAGLRVATTRALLRADAAVALPVLRLLAEDPNLAVRATAVAALGLAGDARDVVSIEKARNEGAWPLGPVAAFALSSLVIRDQTTSDALCALLLSKEPITRANAAAGLRAKRSTRCVQPALAAAMLGARTQAPPFATWRALVLTDGRVLVSHPDALGKVEFPQIDSPRSESPWRLPYGVR